MVWRIELGYSEVITKIVERWWKRELGHQQQRQILRVIFKHQKLKEQDCWPVECWLEAGWREKEWEKQRSHCPMTKLVVLRPSQWVMLKPFIKKWQPSSVNKLWKLDSLTQPCSFYSWVQPTSSPESSTLWNPASPRVLSISPQALSKPLLHYARLPCCHHSHLLRGNITV